MNELSENHSRAFKAIVIVTEKKLVEIELSLYKHILQESVLLQLNEDLNKDEVLSIRTRIHEIREILREFRDKYCLQPEERSLRREVNVTASFLWEDLVGIAGRKMDAYGHLDDVIKYDLDEYLRKITKIVDGIMMETY